MTTDAPEPGSGGRVPLIKLTVNLTPKTVRALDSASARNEESKTDAINRAVQLYALVTSALDEGCDLLLRDADSSVLTKIHLL